MVRVRSFRPAGLADARVPLSTGSFLGAPIVAAIWIFAVLELRVERADPGSIAAGTGAEPPSPALIKPRNMPGKEIATAFAPDLKHGRRLLAGRSILAISRAMLASAKLCPAGRYLKRFLAPLTISCDSFTHGQIMGQKSK